MLAMVTLTQTPDIELLQIGVAGKVLGKVSLFIIIMTFLNFHCQPSIMHAICSPCQQNPFVSVPVQGSFGGETPRTP